MSSSGEETQPCDLDLAPTDTTDTISSTCDGGFGDNESAGHQSVLEAESVTSESEVTSTSHAGSSPWNYQRLDHALEDKNLFSCMSEEDMSQLDAVLSSEVGKKILQELPLAVPPAGAVLETVVAADPSSSEGVLKQDVFLNPAGMSPKLDFDGVLSEPSGPVFELVEMGPPSDLLEDEGELADEFANIVTDGDNPYCESSLTPALRPASPQETVTEQEQPPAEEGEEDKERREEEERKEEERKEEKRQASRRSTRIQDLSQREEADRIRQENQEAERRALEERKRNKFPVVKTYNMRTVRPNKEYQGFILTYGRKKKKEDPGSDSQKSADVSTDSIQTEVEQTESKEDEEVENDGGEANESQSDVLVEEDSSAVEISEEEEEEPKMKELKKGKALRGKGVRGRGLLTRGGRGRGALFTLGRGRMRGGKTSVVGAGGRSKVAMKTKKTKPKQTDSSDKDNTEAKKGKQTKFKAGQTKVKALKKAGKKVKAGKASGKKAKDEDEDSGSSEEDTKKTKKNKKKGKAKKAGVTGDTSDDMEISFPKLGEGPPKGFSDTDSSENDGKDDQTKKKAKAKVFGAAVALKAKAKKKKEEGQIKVKRKKKVKAGGSPKVKTPVTAVSSESEEDLPLINLVGDSPVRLLKPVFTSSPRPKDKASQPTKEPILAAFGKMVGVAPADSSGEDFMSKIMAQDHARMKPLPGEDIETEPVAMETESAELVQGEHATPEKGRRKRTVRGMKKHRTPDKKTEDESDDDEENDESEDDSDSSFTSEDDPDRLWCICKMPYNNRFMICCDRCGEWYHGSCVDVTRKQGREYLRDNKKWNCHKCLGKLLLSSQLNLKDEKAGGDHAHKEEIKSDITYKEGDPEGGDVAVKTEMTKMDDLPQISAIEKREKKKPKEKDAGDAEKKEKKSGDVGKKEKKRDDRLKKDKKGEDGVKKEKKEGSGEKSESKKVKSPAESPNKLRKRHSERRQEKISALQEKLKVLKHKANRHGKELKDGKPGSLDVSQESEEHKSEDVTTVEIEDSPRKSHEERDSKAKSEDGQSKEERVEKKHESKRDSKHHKHKKSSKDSSSRRCIGPNCSHRAQHDSVYCGRDCISKHASESIKLLAKDHPNLDKERIVVFDRKTGKIVTGPTAPTPASLKAFLVKHPMFEVLQPGQHSGSSLSAKREKERKETEQQQLRERRVAREKREAERRLEKQQAQKVHEKVEQAKRELQERHNKERDRRDREQKERERKEKERREKERKDGDEKLRLEGSPPASAAAPNPERINLRKQLRDALTGRADESDDIMLSAAEIKHIAMSIEEQLFRYYGTSGPQYKHRSRYILYHIKDKLNKGLYSKILHGELKPYKLVRLTPEALGSKELARRKDEPAKLDDSLEELPRVETSRAETHAGSEASMKGPPPSVPARHTPQSKPVRIMASPVTPRVDPMADLLGSLIIDTTDRHKSHFFDVNCKICTGRMPEQVVDQPKRARKTVSFGAGQDPHVETKVLEEPAAEVIQDETEPQELAEPLPEEHTASITETPVVTMASPVCYMPLTQPSWTLQAGASGQDPAIGTGYSFYGEPQNRTQTVVEKSQQQETEFKPPLDPRKHSDPRLKSEQSRAEDPRRADPRKVEKKPIQPAAKAPRRPPSDADLLSEMPGQRARQRHHQPVTSKEHVSLPDPPATPSPAGPQANRAVKPPVSIPLQSEASPMELDDDDAESELAVSTTVASPEEKLDETAQYFQSNPVQWQGILFIQDLPKFQCLAYPVSGTTQYLSKELPSTVQVCGRISPAQILDYIMRIRHSTTREIVTVCLQPADDEAAAHYQELYHYLNGRQRCGVVGHINKVIKDMYLFPLPSGAALPKALLPFDGPGLMVNRPDMLLGVVIRLPLVAKQQQLAAAKSEAVKASRPQQSPRPLPSPKASPALKVEEAAEDGESDEEAEDIVLGFGKAGADRVKKKKEKAKPALDAPYSPSRVDVEEAYEPPDFMDSEEPGSSTAEPAAVPGIPALSALLSSLVSGTPMDVTTAMLATLAASASSSVDAKDQQRLLQELDKQVEEQKAALMSKQQALDDPGEDQAATPEAGAAQTEAATVVSSSSDGLCVLTSDAKDSVNAEEPIEPAEKDETMDQTGREVVKPALSCSSVPDTPIVLSDEFLTNLARKRLARKIEKTAGSNLSDVIVTEPVPAYAAMLPPVFGGLFSQAPSSVPQEEIIEHSATETVPEETAEQPEEDDELEQAMNEVGGLNQAISQANMQKLEQQEKERSVEECVAATEGETYQPSEPPVSVDSQAEGETSAENAASTEPSLGNVNVGELAKLLPAPGAVLDWLKGAKLDHIVESNGSQGAESADHEKPCAEDVDTSSELVMAESPKPAEGKEKTAKSAETPPAPVVSAQTSSAETAPPTLAPINIPMPAGPAPSPQIKFALKPKITIAPILGTDKAKGKSPDEKSKETKTGIPKQEGKSLEAGKWKPMSLSESKPENVSRQEITKPETQETDSVSLENEVKQGAAMSASLEKKTKDSSESKKTDVLKRKHSRSPKRLSPKRRRSTSPKRRSKSPKRGTRRRSRSPRRYRSRSPSRRHGRSRTPPGLRRFDRSHRYSPPRRDRDRSERDRYDRSDRRDRHDRSKDRHDRDRSDRRRGSSSTGSPKHDSGKHGSVDTGFIDLTDDGKKTTQEDPCSEQSEPPSKKQESEGCTERIVKDYGHKSSPSHGPDDNSIRQPSREAEQTHSKAPEVPNVPSRMPPGPVMRPPMPQRPPMTQPLGLQTGPRFSGPLGAQPDGPRPVGPGGPHVIDAGYHPPSSVPPGSRPSGPPPGPLPSGPSPTGPPGPRPSGPSPSGPPGPRPSGPPPSGPPGSRPFGFSPSRPPGPRPYGPPPSGPPGPRPSGPPPAGSHGPRPSGPPPSGPPPSGSHGPRPSGPPPSGPPPSGPHGTRPSVPPPSGPLASWPYGPPPSGPPGLRPSGPPPSGPHGPRPSGPPPPRLHGPRPSGPPPSGPLGSWPSGPPPPGPPGPRPSSPHMSGPSGPRTSRSTTGPPSSRTSISPGPQSHGTPGLRPVGSLTPGSPASRPLGPPLTSSSTATLMSMASSSPQSSFRLSGSSPSGSPRHGLLGASMRQSPDSSPRATPLVQLPAQDKGEAEDTVPRSTNNSESENSPGHFVAAKSAESNATKAFMPKTMQNHPGDSTPQNLLSKTNSVGSKVSVGEDPPQLENQPKDSGMDDTADNVAIPGLGEPMVHAPKVALERPRQPRREFDFASLLRPAGSRGAAGEVADQSALEDVKGGQEGQSADSDSRVPSPGVSDKASSLADHQRRLVMAMPMHARQRLVGLVETMTKLQGKGGIDFRRLLKQSTGQGAENAAAQPKAGPEDPRQTTPRGQLSDLRKPFVEERLDSKPSSLPPRGPQRPEPCGPPDVWHEGHVEPSGPSKVMLPRGSQDPRRRPSEPIRGPLDRDQQRGPPDQNRGFPGKHMGPLDQHRGPPERLRGPPDQHRGPPDQHRGPADQHRGPPDQHRGPPDQHRGPPHQRRGHSDSPGPPEHFRGPPDFRRSPDNHRGSPDLSRGPSDRGAPEGFGGPRANQRPAEFKDEKRGPHRGFRGTESHGPPNGSPPHDRRLSPGDRRGPPDSRDDRSHSRERRPPGMPRFPMDDHSGPHDRRGPPVGRRGTPDSETGFRDRAGSQSRKRDYDRDRSDRDRREDRRREHSPDRQHRNRHSEHDNERRDRRDIRRGSHERHSSPSHDHRFRDLDVRSPELRRGPPGNRQDHLESHMDDDRRGRRMPPSGSEDRGPPRKRPLLDLPFDEESADHHPAHRGLPIGVPAHAPLEEPGEFDHEGRDQNRGPQFMGPRRAMRHRGGKPPRGGGSLFAPGQRDSLLGATPTERHLGPTPQEPYAAGLEHHDGFDGPEPFHLAEEHGDQGMSDPGFVDGPPMQRMPPMLGRLRGRGSIRGHGRGMMEGGPGVPEHGLGIGPDRGRGGRGRVLVRGVGMERGRGMERGMGPDRGRGMGPDRGRGVGIDRGGRGGGFVRGRGGDQGRGLGFRPMPSGPH